MDTTRRRVARIVTEVLSPAVVAVALPLAVAWHATGQSVLATVAWGVVVAVFFSVLPMVFLVRGARKGRWEGHWVRDRADRTVPLLVCLLSAMVGMVIMLTGGAPDELLALSWAMIITLAVCLVVTRWWKISVHAAVAGGAVVMLAFVYGPWMLSLALLAALVCWARVEVEDHTPAQVTLGALVGPVVGGATFFAML
jgi:membrane-associated phospholipid phosphatase